MQTFRLQTKSVNLLFNIFSFFLWKLEFEIHYLFIFIYIQHNIGNKNDFCIIICRNLIYCLKVQRTDIFNLNIVQPKIYKKISFCIFLFCYYLIWLMTDDVCSLLYNILFTVFIFGCILKLNLMSFNDIFMAI